MMSFAQELLWYMAQLAPGNPAYNGPFMVRLRGKLDHTAFERALDAVVERHDVFRTVFLASKGVPAPYVVKKRRAQLKHVDLRDISEDAREQGLQERVRVESAVPFDLARDPMARSTLFCLGEEEHAFLCVIHHIVFEGSSVGIFFRDLAGFYNGFLSGKQPQLPELHTSYSDFSAWQRKALQGERLARLNEYWRNRLTDAPTIDLPLDFPRPARHTMRGAKHRFTIPQQVIADADAFLKQSGTTSYRALLGVFNVLLRCYSGSTDISVGTPCAARCRGIENLIGFFVNTVVLRIDTSDDPSFRKLIRKVDAALHGAIAHSELPFSKIVEAVQPQRDTSRTPLFQTNFRVPQQPYPPLCLHGISAGPIELQENGTSKFDLAMEIGQFVGEMNYVEYCSDLFKEETIVQMEADFSALLQDLVAHPDLAISQSRTARTIADRVRSGSATVAS